MAEENTVVGKELALACARAAYDVKAESIVLLDLRGVSSLTDYMVICSGMSMPHLKAVMRDVSNALIEKHHVKPTYFDGNIDTKWVVLDYVDVMVHVMHEEARELYGLEELWGDAKQIDWEA